MTTTPQELERKFWKALKSDRTLMLGLDGVEDGHSRPMTAQVEGESSPIWFFAGKPNALVDKLGHGGHRAIAAFSAKGHELFASIRGQLRIDNDRAVIERLWNPFNLDQDGDGELGFGDLVKAGSGMLGGGR